MGVHSGCVALGPEAADYVGSHFWLSLAGPGSCRYRRLGHWL
jgi:hypothetical protein